MVLHIGLNKCHALATFQRLMDLILAGVQWSRCLVYLDDIIAIDHDFGEHLQIFSIIKRVWIAT